MRHDNTMRTVTRDGVPLFSIIELEATLQSGGLLTAAEKDCETDKSGTHVSTKEVENV